GLAVLVVGVVVAVATPKVASALRNYRLNIATRQMTDLVHRAKMQAVAENRRSSIAIDTDARRICLVVYKWDNVTMDRVKYMPLPSGIRFQAPSNAEAPVSGAPTDRSVSFPLTAGSNHVYQQDFTSRGFPSVAAGTVNAIYLTNGRSYRAVTVSSVGALRTWSLEESHWVAPHR